MLEKKMDSPHLTAVKKLFDILVNYTKLLAYWEKKDEFGTFFLHDYLP